MKIITISYLRLKQMLRSPKEWALYLITPTLLVLMMSHFINLGYAPKQIPIALIDQDQSEYSKLVVERVKAKPIISVEKVREEEIERLIMTNQLEAVYIIKKGFQVAIISKQISGTIKVLKSPSSISTGVVSQVVASEVIRLSSNVRAADYVINKYKDLQATISPRDQLWQEAWKYSDHQGEPDPLMGIEYQELGVLEHPEVNHDAEYIQKNKEMNRTIGLLASVVMLLSIFSMSWLIEERRNGILKRIQSTTTDLPSYIVGNALGVLFLIWSISLCVLVYIYFLNPVWSFAVLTKVIWIFFAYVLLCISIGLAWVSWLSTMGQLQALGSLFVIMTSVLGSTFIPLAETSTRFTLFSSWMPQGILMKGLRDAYMFQFEHQDYWTAILFLIIYTLLFLLWALMGWRQKEKS